MTSHVIKKITLSKGQQSKLASALKNRSGVSFKLKKDELSGGFPILLTKTLASRLEKARAAKTGVVLDLSKALVVAYIRSLKSKGKGAEGGILPLAIAPLLPVIIPALASLLSSIVGGISAAVVSGNKKAEGGELDFGIDVPAEEFYEERIEEAEEAIQLHDKIDDATRRDLLNLQLHGMGPIAGKANYAAEIIFKEALQRARALISSGDPEMLKKGIAILDTLYDNSSYEGMGIFLPGMGIFLPGASGNPIKKRRRALPQ